MLGNRMPDSLKPYFVADRPMSLRMLSGLNFQNYPVKLGIMTHAKISSNLRRMFQNSPCIDLSYCGVVDGGCPVDGELEKCAKGQVVLEAFDIICDSGVFQKEGVDLDYDELFSRYEEIGASKGIIKDVIGDPSATLRQARIAMEAFLDGNYSFELVAVAHGSSPDEYLSSYRELKNLGYKHVAVGGLLREIQTRRNQRVKMDEVSKIVIAIREHYPEDWLLTLGIYHPSRHQELSDLGVDAADYSGWIYQYSKRFKDKIKAHIDRRTQTRKYIENRFRML